MNSSTRFVLVSAALGLFLAIGCGTPESTEADTGGPAFQELSFDEALAKAKTDNKIVMVDFTADWCPPCRQLEDTTWKNPKVKQWLRENTVAIKVDVDQHKGLAQRYKAPPIPRLVFLKPDGSEVGDLLGYRDAGRFLQEARSLTGLN